MCAVYVLVAKLGTRSLRDPHRVGTMLIGIVNHYPGDMCARRFCKWWPPALVPTSRKPLTTSSSHQFIHDFHGLQCREILSSLPRSRGRYILTTCEQYTCDRQPLSLIEEITAHAERRNGQTLSLHSMWSAPGGTIQVTQQITRSGRAYTHQCTGWS